MRRGSSDIVSRGHRGRSRLDAGVKTSRNLRHCVMDLEGLESRTLLATIPAATATGAPIDLTGLLSVAANGNANSPMVVVDPYDSQKIFAVWGIDASQEAPPPTPTTAFVNGAYSNNGGTSWLGVGGVATPQLDVATINATPPTQYTQITEPSVAFDGKGDVYVLSLQTSGANDGLLYLTQFNFSGNTPVFTSSYNVYQWVSGADAATDAVLSVDTANPAAPGTPDPHAGNVYIAWASIDTEPANPNPYVIPGFNPDRAELAVGTPIASPPGNEEPLAFSGVTTVSTGGNFGTPGNSQPQLVINHTDGGQVTIAWDDYGPGAKASPPFDELLSSLVQPGDTYGFTGATGPFLNGIPSPPAPAPTPVTTPFTDSVTVPNQAAIDNLTVTIDLVDQQTVQNLNLTLVAPDGVHSIVLVENQNNAAGTANTGQGLPSGNAIGVFGFTTGATGTPGRNVGTIFDDNATRNIFDPTTTGTNGNSATDFIGTFQPEGGSLRSFLASLGGVINGQWTLEITNFASAAVTGFPNPGQLQHFSLQFSTGMTHGSPSSINTTLVTGAINNNFANKPPASPSVGVGPGLAVAIDNTLGSASPYQGRIYVAYVVYFNDADPNTHKNPTSNTDIALSYSNNGGQTWIYDGLVNDDAATLDGYSGSSIDSTSAYTSGRTQFQPEVAVDQTTGTLVVSWRDARNDAANARVATYITTSIDGGNSFSAQTYANPSQTAVDAITGQTDIIGPLGDNQSGGDGAQADSSFGYGDQMGLAVSDGHLFPVWAGNFNAAYLVNNAVTAYPLNIWYRPMVIAAGPRIVTSSMGPIPFAEAATGTHQVSISVTFDRPVTATTFVPGDVQVFYHNTTNGSASVPLTVVSVSPVASSGSGPGNAYGYTQFTIIFDATAAGPIYTGTYSYTIAPDNGSPLIISTPIESYNGTVLGTFDQMDQNADGTSNQNAVTKAFTGLTPGDVYAAPAPQPVSPVTFNGAASILTPPFNQNTLPLIVPGPQVLSTSVPNGNSAAGNLITDGTTSTLSVTFDRPMQASTFTPSQVLQIMGPTGSISGPQFFPSTSSTGQIIPAATNAATPGVLNSTLSVPSYDGTFTVAHITVELNAAFSPDSKLTAVLIAPNGTQVALFSGVGGSGANFVNTIFDDSAENSIATGTAPFTGTFQPTGKLSTLNGATVDMQNFALQWVPGVWTLKLTNSSTGATGMLDNWSLNVTPVISVSPQTGTATTFTIGFPLQQLSGTYTIQLGPNILDTSNEGLDTNQNAGLAVLRDQGQNSPTTTVNYSSVDLPKTITGAGSVSSTITVPDSFTVQGDTTTSGISGMQVQISITYPHDPDLSATLYYDFGTPGQVAVPLFSGVGNGTQTANFANTLFDDNAATPIQNGSAPFFATFNPQLPLAAFAGLNAKGTWTLVIQNASGSGTGTFNRWSVSFQKPLPTTGLAEPGSDDFTASFRIFTLSQADSLSSQEWTAVGPASIGGGSTTPGGSDPSGRVTGLAIDPSDPSGNTVYAAGASGGIWKTTDFLTTSAAGPTWIPLTDFGPTSGVNIGGIAVFPRNNNPNQSIIIAATGEGDTGTPGVGFLISKDGGATWNLYDSTVNVDSSGNILPISSSSRNREFVGNTSFAVVVDPRPTPSGQVIIYAAMSGTNGGIWRSEDTGQTWTLLLAGQATDVVLDRESGAVLDPATDTEVQGNLQVVYAAIRGTGVFMSPNQGQVWNQMLGGIGNPLIFDTRFAPAPNVNPVNGPTPNGGQGRISLAVPNPTGNAAEDAVYEGWLYAIVATPAGALDGIFVTKDFGQNWTEVRIPTEPNQGYVDNPSIPANDVGLADFPIIGSAQFPQGNYNMAIAVDPTDPSVIYVGGTVDGNETGLIRINLTDIWDAHSLVAYSDQANDGGALNLASTGPATVADPLLRFSSVNGQDSSVSPTSYLNYIRGPQDPFVAGATLDVFNYGQFTNNGNGVEWIPFDVGGTDYHRVVTMVDPTTGLPRLIFGNDQGIWSVLDNNGTFETSIGASDAEPITSRNGNLQITQFYYGAAQPSNAAALIAGSLFYGSAQDNGGPSSSAGVINSGNIVWNGPGGDATGVATDQQGLGTSYQYFWPCCGSGYTDFFLVNGVARTSGLLQASGGQPTPDPQWPFKGGANFAVDAVNGQDIVISSAVGRIFSTTNEGVTWFDIGDPTVFGSPGSFSVALAYGAPDPNAPEGVGNLGNFIYVGTQAGKAYVTQDGGGSGASNNWLNISLGLDGSAVESIITDPTRGSHDAYAVTSTGVFYLPDSILLGNNPTNTAYEWVNITANLKTLAYSIFGQSYNPATDPTSAKYNQAVFLSSIVADWRYAIPNETSYANGPAYHPVLYVSAGDSFGTGSGVYQSLDGGTTWTYFPDTTYGAVVEGGYLPNVAVTSLSLSLGDLDPNTGRSSLAGPDQAFVFSGTLTSGSQSVTGIVSFAGLAAGDTVTGTGIPTGTTISSVSSSTDTITLSAKATATGTESLAAANPNTTPDPDVLMAATYGQGEFAINLAPLILGNAVTVAPTTAGTGTTPTVTGPITISGSSEISGFGDTTWITIEDVTNPADPVVIGGFNPANPVPTPGASNSTNTLGKFAIPFDPASYYTSNGTKTIKIFATDNAGSVGNVITYTFNLQDSNLPQPPPTSKPTFSSNLAILPADIKSGPGITPPVTNLTQPVLTGATNAGTTITVYEFQQVGGNFVQFGAPYVLTSGVNANGSFSFPFLNPTAVENGTFEVYVTAQYTLYPGLGTTQSNPLTFKIDNTTPAAVTDFRLNPANDTGIVGDNITSDRTPQFIGTASSGDIVDLIEIIPIAGTLTNGSPSVTGVSSARGLAVGEGVIGTGIPPGATILAINSANASLTLTVNATVSGPQILAATALMDTSTAGQSATDSNGKSYDFTTQLPLALTNGQIEIGVFVIDPFSANVSPLSNPVTVSIVSVASDYNDDGYADAALFIRNATTNQGIWSVQTTLGVPKTPAPPPFWFGSGIPGTPFGPSNSIPFQGDFDGDGKADLAYYVPGTGAWVFVDSKTVTLTTFTIGTPNLSVPVTGNFDANGPDEAGVFTINSAKQGVWTIVSAFTGLRTVIFGQSGDVPVPGDYLGLGYAQLAVYRPSTGIFYVLEPNGTTQTLNPGQGGSTSLLPVPGAYDNLLYSKVAQPGRTEAAVYNPYTGVYSILGPVGTYYVGAGFQIGDIPVPADYLGNGSTQPAVFRPGTGQFIAEVLGNPTVIATFPVASGVVPLAAPLFYRTPVAPPALAALTTGSATATTGPVASATATTATGTTGMGTTAGTTGTVGTTTGTGTGTSGSGGTGTNKGAGTGSTGTSTTPPAQPPVGSPPGHKKTITKKPVAPKKTIVKPTPKKMVHSAPKPKAVPVVSHLAKKVVNVVAKAATHTTKSTDVVDLALETVHVNLRKSTATRA